MGPEPEPEQEPLSTEGQLRHCQEQLHETRVVLSLTDIKKKTKPEKRVGAEIFPFPPKDPQRPQRKLRPNENG